ncbi:hypothetical protein AVEN_161421-1 [Araneus ventricosus]|uniref:Uncharacterized protein n=1 Tax=Araneus ventricosus TaxID=182803 RepID=A0A4Y2BR76_ARAVE|nr:hypothetical protein AVEN_161421-1 [Araneus ventricosus]
MTSMTPGLVCPLETSIPHQREGVGPFTHEFNMERTHMHGGSSMESGSSLEHSDSEVLRTQCIFLATCVSTRGPAAMSFKRRPSGMTQSGKGFVGVCPFLRPLSASELGGLVVGNFVAASHDLTVQTIPLGRNGPEVEISTLLEIPLI